MKKYSVTDKLAVIASVISQTNIPSVWLKDEEKLHDFVDMVTFTNQMKKAQKCVKMLAASLSTLLKEA